MKKSDAVQAVKFALFSASAGLIQIGSFEGLRFLLLKFGTSELLSSLLVKYSTSESISLLLQKFVFESLEAVPYWPVYLTSLVLSVLWNFTFNRRFTFKSAANIPIAMAKVAGFYLVFTPLSTWLGELAAQKSVPDTIVLICTMLANFILEYLFCKFVVYRGQENTREDAKKEENE